MGNVIWIRSSFVVCEASSEQLITIIIEKLHLKFAIFKRAPYIEKSKICLL
jgi:hypothetical protein